MVTAMEMKSIIAVSAENNKACEVTGVLLYNGITFLQVLEGKKENVKSLYQKIAIDERHSAITTIFREDIEARIFSEWSMKLKIVASSAEALPDWIEEIEDVVAEFPPIPPSNLKSVLTSYDTVRA
ncbi:MAG: BLUF domain-containing protein [Marinicaulis sp.]|nr:BLUF domain-containing protein [Marinicaulis sp.]